MNCARRVLLAAIIMISVFFLPASTAAAPENDEESIEEQLKEQLQTYDMSQWDAALSNETSGVLPTEYSSVSDMVEGIALGDMPLDAQGVFDTVKFGLKAELKSNTGIFLTVMAACIVSGLIEVMINAKGMSGIKETAGFVCYGMAVSTAVYALGRMVTVARDTVTRIAEITETVSPTLILMLSASGNIAVSSAVSPLLAFLSSTVIKIIEMLILPIILMGGVLAVISNMTERPQLGELYNLSKTASKWALGFIFTIYIGITVFTGISAASTGGLSARTAKFAIDKFVPVIGGMVSGTVDTVLLCSTVIKNASGLSAVLLVLGAAAVPVLKLTGTIFTLRICAAACQPMCDSRIVKMLASTADVSTYMLASVVGVGLMFIITAGIIIVTGNIYIYG